MAASEKVYLQFVGPADTLYDNVSGTYFEKDGNPKRVTQKDADRLIALSAVGDLFKLADEAEAA